MGLDPPLRPCGGGARGGVGGGFCRHYGARHGKVLPRWRSKFVISTEHLPPLPADMSSTAARELVNDDSARIKREASDDEVICTKAEASSRRKRSRPTRPSAEPAHKQVRLTLSMQVREPEDEPKSEPSSSDSDSEVAHITENPPTRRYYSLYSAPLSPVDNSIE